MARRRMIPCGRDEGGYSSSTPDYWTGWPESNAWKTSAVAAGLQA